MRLSMGMIAGLLLLFGTAGSGLAVVNCKQVNKYLDTGRTVKDVAETMVIDEAEVRKCQEQAAEGKAGEAKTGETKGAEEKK
jgi:hypothetical protein